ncbi:MAG: sugar ABC transporter ATP-binding protein [Acidimicrobiia bacterium]
MQALDRVSLDLRPGEIHALVGENGSGKSTLVKVLSGVHPPESGRMLHLGEPVDLRTPSAARDRGVATIHQEFSLVPSLTVAENVYLGRFPRRLAWVDWRAARSGSARTLQRLGIELDPDRPVGSLSVAEQQLVEIAKAISLDMSLLILDEPTAALGPGEAERLHGVIRLLASQGTAVLYISHRLDEILQACDVVSVLRDGRKVGTAARSEVTLRRVIRMMIGTDLEEYYPREKDEVRRRPRLEVLGISTADKVRGASFSVAAGEVLGLGGVVGSGRTEIARALFGLDRLVAGEIRLDGRPFKLTGPADAIQAGIAYLPENRRADGLFFNFSLPPNVTMAALHKIKRGPVLSLKTERARAGELVEELDIHGRAADRSVRFLSGGNQQKVVLGRWLFSEAGLLILDEPTQGIDVQAKLEVYRVISRLTRGGASVILISSDYPELLAISDRVAVVRDGTVMHVSAAGDLAEHELVEMASGGLEAVS